jgi:Uma2 family endonuclease
MSVEQYLAWENAFVQGRHEFVGGEVFAMTGTSMNHNEATLNLIGALRRALSGTPCRAFGMDIKVRIDAANAFFYPDIVVGCDAADFSRDGPGLIESPKVIVEVASPSTSEYDAMGKFARYRLSPTLMEYVLISADNHDLTVYRKQADGQWVIADASIPQTLELRSLELSIPFAEIFANVRYVAPPTDR